MDDKHYFNPYRKFHGSFVPNDLMKYSGISSGAKLVYGRLSQFAGESGACFPSYKKIAGETGLSPRQVIRLINELVKDGFLVKEAQLRRDGSSTSNVYKFLWHRCFAHGDNLSPQSDIMAPGSENMALQDNNHIKESNTKKQKTTNNESNNCSEAVIKPGRMADNVNAERQQIANMREIIYKSPYNSLDDNWLMEMVGMHGYNKVYDVLDVVVFQAKKNKTEIIDPAAYIYKILQKSISSPADFEPYKERKAKEEKKEMAKLNKKLQEARDKYEQELKIKEVTEVYQQLPEPVKNKYIERAETKAKKIGINNNSIITQMAISIFSDEQKVFKEDQN